MKYWIDRAIIATIKYPGINNWISFSDILTSIFSTDTTILPAASTTTSGIVEFATTAETSAGAVSNKAVTPLSMAKYVGEIDTPDWVIDGTVATFEVLGSTHGKGLYPVVTLTEKTGAGMESTLPYTYYYNITTGNIIITINTGLINVARVIIN